MTILQIVIVVVLAGLGALAYREVTALRRWDPAFFRSGPIVLRQASSLASTPSAVPEPVLSRSWFGWRPEARRLGPLEVAFTAQVLNAPLMKGLLCFDEAERAIVVTGRVYWGITPLFVVGLVAIPLLFDPVFSAWCGLVLAALVGTGFPMEVRRFREALASSVSQVQDGAG